MRIGQTSIIFFLSKLGSTLLSYLAMVYFARLLGSETLGIYFLIIAVITWLNLIGTLGLNSAIIKRLSEGDQQAEYVAAGLILQTVILLPILAIIYYFRSPIESYIGATVSEFVILIFILNILFAFVRSILKGTHRVHIYSILDVCGNSGRTVFQLGAVVAGFGLTGMLIGHAFGTALTIISSTYVISKELRVPKKHHFISLLSYAKYAWVGGFQSKTFSWMDTIVLGFFVSSGLIGIYEIAWNIASFMAIFSIAISQTLFPEISDASSDGKLNDVSSYLQDGITYCGLFLIPGLFGSLLIGEQILAIYGEEFTQGVYILTLLIFARLIYSYQRQFTTTLNSIDRPDLAFRVNFVFVGFNFSFNITFIWMYVWTGAAVATVCSAAIGLLVGYLYVRKQMMFEVPTSELSKQWIAAIVMTLILAAIIQALGAFDRAINIPVAIVLAGVGAGIFFSTLTITSSRFRSTVFNNIPLNIP